jgi:hypothetical protein
MPSGVSTRLLCTKTFACGLATITRAGGGTRRPEAVRNSRAGSGSLGLTTGRGGAVGVTEAGGGSTGAGGAGGGDPRTGTLWEGGLGGKSGVVLAVGGAPVSGGAVGRGAGASETGGGVAFEMLGIGLVTAVDHAGGTLLEGAGSNWVVEWIGRVVAAETFGRGVGVIFPVAGLSGRGGRLIRSVSRLGAFGSLPSGVESAIVMCFYSYFLKCSMAKFAIITDL